MRIRWIAVLAGLATMAAVQLWPERQYKPTTKPMRYADVELPDDEQQSDDVEEVWAAQPKKWGFDVVKFQVNGRCELLSVLACRKPCRNGSEIDWWTIVPADPDWSRWQRRYELEKLEPRNERSIPTGPVACRQAGRRKRPSVFTSSAFYSTWHHFLRLLMQQRRCIWSLLDCRQHTWRHSGRCRTHDWGHVRPTQCRKHRT